MEVDLGGDASVLEHGFAGARLVHGEGGFCAVVRSGYHMAYHMGYKEAAVTGSVYQLPWGIIG